MSFCTTSLPCSSICSFRSSSLPLHPPWVTPVPGKDGEGGGLFSVNQAAVCVFSGEFTSENVDFTEERTLSALQSSGLLQLCMGPAGGAVILGVPVTTYRVEMFHWMWAESLPLASPTSSFRFFFVALKRNALPGRELSSSIL